MKFDIRIYCNIIFVSIRDIIILVRNKINVSGSVTAQSWVGGGNGILKCADRHCVPFRFIANEFNVFFPRRQCDPGVVLDPVSERNQTTVIRSFNP